MSGRRASDKGVGVGSTTRLTVRPASINPTHWFLCWLFLSVIFFPIYISWRGRG
jgi:hypothetical protein